MATFVHNEPTSLAIIQEAGVPEAFYKAIEMGLEPAIEVSHADLSTQKSALFPIQIVQAIPNAIGALCLNEVGQAQLSRRPSIIPAIFSIFTSDRHLKVLLDKENAVLIGTAIDELIRHHPSLKTPVFEALKSTLSKIEDLGNAFQVPESIKRWYQLVPVPPKASPGDGDIPMEDVETTGTAVTSDQVTEQSEDNTADADNSYDEDPATKAHDNNVVSFIDIMGRVSRPCALSADTVSDI